MEFSYKIHKTFDDYGSTKAIGILYIDKVVGINSVRVMSGKNGLFVSMPQFKGKDGKYNDHCFITDNNLREKMSKCVLDTYAKAVAPSEDEDLPFDSVPGRG